MSAGSRHWEPYLDWLACSWPFSSLPDHVAELLATHLGERSFKTGELLVRQGETGDSLLLLTEGRARVVVRDPDGQEKGVATVGRGKVVGEMALLTREPRTADVIAEEPVRALRLSAESFLELAARHPSLSVVLSDLVALRFGCGETDVLRGKCLEGHRVKRCVGRGGMAVVYEAVREADGRTVALKMMSHSLVFHPDLFARFQREAKIQAGLRHENIVALLGQFSAYNTYFLVLEFCEGVSIKDLVEEVGALSEAEVRAVLGQLARAVEYLHGEGVIHRDIKASNVMIDTDGRAKLMDFGIARPELDSQLTQEGVSVGTPLFMSPEQMSGQGVDGRTDTYAMGCLAYLMLTGEPPFKGTNFASIYAEKLRWEIPPREVIRKDLSEDLYEFLRLSLAVPLGERTLRLADVTEWAGKVDLRGIRSDPARRHFDRDPTRSFVALVHRDPAAYEGDLEERLEDLWRRLGGRSDAGAVYHRLAALYGEPSRTYHDLSHIRQCLGELDLVLSLANRPDEVEAALWFHDSILDPKATDNEARSAKLAESLLAEARVGVEIRGRVVEMILATRHAGGRVAFDASLTADIDLSGLAAVPARFDSTTERILEEGRRGGMPDARASMRAFLEKILGRPFIYQTPYYRETCEAAARANLERATQRLRELGEP